jgi:hypothetical protein
MRGIEIAVDGGGGDGRRRRNGRQDGSGRTAGRPRQGREMGSVHLIFLILMREIFHIIGIHKQVGEPKKGEKKVCTVFRKGEIGGLTFFSTFFSIVEFFGNTQMIARRYKTYIRRFGEERKKKKVTCAVTTGLK